MTTPTRDEDLDTEHHIVIDILQELEGRKGMGISDLDEETQQEITDKFIEIVKEHLETAEREAFDKVLSIIDEESVFSSKHNISVCSTEALKQSINDYKKTKGER